ncbi:hypothetical protein [Burkholderia sp.]|uniref:hypothetical protein n=1 Tax=Burkholderia sp. TaxID=36773 RepID=UPI0025874F72|nr:hypothetical protein [Burkholderia sp.]MCL4635225.1 hypothetical protein [Burkholderia sp.]
MQKKNAQSSKTESSANVHGDFTKIHSPRQVRALRALLASPAGLAREALDRVAGCSNGPALIADLRAKGLEVPCFMRTVHDRDGKEVEAGVYVLTELDRNKVGRWLAAHDRVAA